MIKNYTLTSSAAGYTAAAAVAVTSIALYNYDTVDRIATVYLQEGGASAANSNTFVKVTIPTTETVHLSFEGKTLVLAAHDKLMAIADADTKVTMTLSLMAL